MAPPRGATTVDAVKEPHSVSLKVLRLSRPSLSIQHPLPLPTPTPSPSGSPSTFPSPSASLAYPQGSGQSDDAFILSPLLTLPPAFGSAYVGETFSCTLCANNEMLPGANTPKTISNVRIEAEMKIPSSAAPIPLGLHPNTQGEAEDDTAPGGGVEGQKHHDGVDLEPGRSLQKIVDFDLKEEGSHVLAVTVTYTETTPTSGKVRTFRKLYQFVCKGCMVVRTKTGVLPSSPKDGSNDTGRKWALEAQLENSGEETITLDTVALETREGIKSQGVNWEVVAEGEEMERPVLMPGDVQQVCFLVEEVLGPGGEGLEPVDGKVVFGILSIGWRGTMGNRGFLSTGSLGARII